MGRYDALTSIEEQPQSAKPVKTDPSSIDEKPLEEHNANLLVNQQNSKLANQQTSKETNQQTSKSANQQDSLLTNQQNSKLALSTKQKKKYGTYLRPDSITEIHISAAVESKKDHELLQDIVDYYFDHHKKSSR